MSVVSEIKKGNKKIKAAQLDRITDISGRYFAEYNSSTGECKNPVAEPITNIVITGNSTKVNADPDIPNDYIAIEYIELKDKQYIDTGIGSFQDIEVTYQLVGDISEQKQYAKLLYNLAHPLESTYGAEVRTDSKTFTTVNNTKPISIAYNNNKTNLSLSYRVKEPKYLSLQLKWTIGASSETANVRVYNVKFTNNADTLNGTVGKIDGDFYPVIRKSDNKPGMYDKVSKQFFVNQGTGEFITGPELPGKILETDTLTKRGKNLVIINSEWKRKSEYLEAHNGYFEINYDNVTDSTVYILNYIDNSHLKLIPGHTYTLKHIVHKYADNTNNHNYIEFGSYATTVCAIPSEARVPDNYGPITFIAQKYNISEIANDSIRVVIGVAPHTKRHERYYTMITETSTEQIYEPYQQPEVISFDKDAGNMLNIPDQGPTTINGITYTIKDGVITLNGTSTDAVILLLGDVIPTNSTNSFRVFNESKTFTTNSIRFYSFYDVGSNVHNWIDYLGSKDAWTNTNYDVGLSRKFRLHIYAGQTFNDYIVKPMLVEGSVIPNKFYSYGTKIPDPVFGINDIKDKILVSHAVGKNVLNVVNKEITYGGIKFKIENGMVNLISGTNSVRVNIGIAKLKDMPAGTYTLKQFYTPTKNIGIIGSIFTINDDGSEQFFDYFDNCINGVNSKVYSIPKKWRADVQVDIRNPNTTVDNEKLYPMLVYGSTEPKEFEPYMLNRVYHYHVANKIDLGTFDYNLVTLDGNPGFVAKLIPPNMQIDDTSINDAGYKYDGSLSKDRTFNTHRGSGGPWFRNDAFTRDQQGCDDLKASLSGKYLLYPLLTPYYEDVTDTELGQKLLNLTPYQPYTTEFEVNNDGTIEFGYWRQIDPLPDTYTRVKALVSDGNQKITVNDIVGKNLFNIHSGFTMLRGSAVPDTYKFTVEGTKVTYTTGFYNRDTIRFGIPFKVKPNTNYCFSFIKEYASIVDSYPFHQIMDKNGEYLYYNNGRPFFVFNSGNNDILYYCPMIASWNDIYSISNIQIEEGTQPTPYSPYISTMQNNSLEMSEPKKTLFQNKDNRVLSVDGYALKYNQLRMNSYSFTNAGVTITANGGYETIVTGTSQASSIWSKKITNDYYSKNGHLYGFIFPVQDLSAFRQVGCYLFANKGAGDTIAGKYASSNSLIVLQATQNDCSLEIGIAVNQDTTINSKIIYQTVDLTDMFGAGNEPTTLDEFYATPQGKLYRGYVEYGYHILGAGEYKSNQLVRNGKDITTGWEAYNSSNISVSYSNGAVIATSLKNEEGYGYPFGIQTNVGGKIVKGNKYLLVVDCKTEREDTTMYFDDIGNQHAWSVGKNWTKHEYIWTNTNFINDYSLVMLIKPKHALRLGETYQVREAYLVNLTELGLDHLTLDELKAQRPDLFVYKPYHETETRYGMILSDGRVHPLTGPLYGINNIKDKGDTVGKENKKYGSYTFTGDESYESVTYKRVYVTPSSSFTPKLTGNRSDIANCIFPNLKTVGEDRIEGGAMQIGINQRNGTIGIVLEKYTDSSDMGDIQAVKNAIIGKTLIYELATTTTTQSTSTSIDMDTSVTNEEYTESFTPVEQWIAKYYSGTHAVLNYIPAVRNSDLKPGMYEVATGEFKTNEGTGEFTYINDWTVAEPVTLEVDENKVGGIV